MGTVLLLALAAAVYPQLLAVVVIILTRPNPRSLLWACYLGALVVNIGVSVSILVVFRARGTIAGTSSRSLGPATYLTVGTIALALAIMLVAVRGRESSGQGPRSVRGGGAKRKPPGAQAVARMRSRAESRLRDGSLAVAALVGGLLAVPGPFDLLALGHIARGDYGAAAAGAMIVAFALIKFTLIELPIASYALDPDGTESRVSRFSSWMRTNKLIIAAAVIAVIGVGFIVSGILSLV
jgi:hypothetical protein